MTSRKLPPIGLLLFLAFSAVTAFSQTKTLVLPKPTPIPPPGNIQLLDNYVHEKRQTIDTSEGSFVRSDGFKINYWNGSHVTDLAANAIGNEKEKIVWDKQLIHFDDIVSLVYFKDGRLIASIHNSRANFIALTKTSEVIADFMLIVMTYQPAKREKAVLIKKN